MAVFVLANGQLLKKYLAIWSHCVHRSVRVKRLTSNSLISIPNHVEPKRRRKQFRSAATRTGDRWIGRLLLGHVGRDGAVHARRIRVPRGRLRPGEEHNQYFDEERGGLVLRLISEFIFLDLN